MAEFKEYHPEEEDPKGHPPLQLEYRDGNLYFRDGAILKPSILIGPEKYHRDLFLEYERTFGRGMANYDTHDPDAETNEVLNTRHGEGFAGEYRQIRDEYLVAASSTNQEQVENLIRKIKDYRRKYPTLYDDVKDPNTSTPAPRIKIRKSENE